MVGATILGLFSHILWHFVSIHTHMNFGQLIKTCGKKMGITLLESLDVFGTFMVLMV